MKTEATSYQRLREHLSYLGLTTMAEHLSAELDPADKDKLSATQVLSRCSTSRCRPPRRAAPVAGCALLTFRFTRRWPTLTSTSSPTSTALIAELSTLRFVEERRNVILLGPPGVGKTHLAIALGVTGVTEAGYPGLLHLRGRHGEPVCSRLISRGPPSTSCAPTPSRPCWS